MSEKSLYSRIAYREILKEVVNFVNEKNNNLDGYQTLELLELAKALVDHKPNKLIPTSLYYEINGKGDSAIIPKELCNAMLKNKADKRCSRKVKKPGDEFCFHHIKVLNDGGSIRTWDEYQTMKNKNYRGKRLKSLQDRMSKYIDISDDEIIVEVELGYDTE